MNYAVLLRGVNVGGKNKISMTDLKTSLEKCGCTKVATLLNSGNAVFVSEEPKAILAQRIQQALTRNHTFDSELIKVLILSVDEVKKVIKDAPKDFGQSPQKYHSDVVFLINESSAEAMKSVEVHPEVDKAWQGEGVLYYQRLSAMRTKSRLAKVITTPIYKSMTIRTWGTVNRLLAKLESL